MKVYAGGGIRYTQVEVYVKVYGEVYADGGVHGIRGIRLWRDHHMRY